MSGDVLARVLAENSLVTAFVVVGVLVAASYRLSAWLTRGHIHGSAVAIALGLVLAYAGGVATGGSKGPGRTRSHSSGSVSACSAR